MDDAELKKCRFYALKVIDFRPRSMEEVRTKLEAKGYPADIIEKVTEEFVKKGLIDDYKFAKLWVGSRMASRPKASRVLKKELEEKGIDGQVISKIIDEARANQDDYVVVKQLAEERAVHLKDVDRTAAKRRLFGFLKRRGFETELIMKVIHEVIN